MTGVDMVPDYGDIELRKEALETARLLLECGAVTYSGQGRPFRPAQGFATPLRVDCRAALSCPNARAKLLDLALETIERDADGVQTIAAALDGAAVPLATLIADRRRAPLVFVRREDPAGPHKHRVEGTVEAGSRVLLVDQLLTDGLRKAALVEPLTQAGASVTDLFVIFQYGVFDRAHENLAPLGVQTHALATWWDLLEVARDRSLLPAGVIAEVGRFLKDPAGWGAGADPSGAAPKGKAKAKA
ncbi:MAG TPA: orotate phosphoribosyltransferase [Azospirillaceae bacterium]|nr:orotate phosphoribosyltransferase [Azospirillaceae bacterium]